jgi:hypothetical protein
MRRFLSVALLVCVAVSGFAQLDIVNMKSAFETFAQDVANVLPFNASIGLGWSMRTSGSSRTSASG